MSNRVANKIPNELYEQILENTIVSAVDAVIYHNGKVLLALRKQDPCKGQWWVPGGRQEKGETGEEAVIRKVRQEIGIPVKIEKLVGVYDVQFDKTVFQNVKTGAQYVARVYLVGLVVPNDAKDTDMLAHIRLDHTQEQYKWISSVEDDLHDYVKKVLKESGVFEK